MRRKENQRGSPLAMPMRGDKALAHVGRRRQPAAASVPALTVQWGGDQVVARAHGSG
jgi:hypothetical protein